MNSNAQSDELESGPIFRPGKPNSQLENWFSGARSRAAEKQKEALGAFACHQIGKNDGQGESCGDSAGNSGAFNFLPAAGLDVLIESRDDANRTSRNQFRVYALSFA